MSSIGDNGALEPRETRTKPRTVLPTTRARQGVTGHNVRYVLGFGLAAIVIAFAVIYVVYFG